MARHFFSILISLALLFTFTGCKDQDIKGETPVIKIEEGLILSNSISVTVNVTKAEKAAWICIENGKDLPSADDILSTGNSIAIDEDVTVTEDNLNANTEYLFAVAAISSTGVSAIEQKNYTTDEEFDGIVLNSLADAFYRSDNVAGAGNYSVILSSDGKLDENGFPANVGGMLLQLDFYNVADEQPIDATLPEGEYKIGEEYEAFTWAPLYSCYYYRNGTGVDDVDIVYLLDGTINVERSQHSYVITCEVTTSKEEKIRIRYSGNIDFVQTGTASFDPFEDDVTVELESCEGRYWGNWFNPHADDFVLNFYNGKKDENGKIVDGYHLYIPMFMHKLEDPYSKDVKIEEGIYTVIPTINSPAYLVPMTFDRGGWMELLEVVYPAGTYLTYYDQSTGKNNIGFCIGGTIEVKQNGGKNYTFKFDFETSDKHRINGEYTGEIDLKNFCDNSTMPQRPWSTLESDIEMNITDRAVANAMYLGNYLYPTLESWLFVLAQPDTEGDMITFQFFKENGTGKNLDDATFTITKDFVADGAFPGFMPYGGGELLYAWYGDLSSVDSEGYATKLAPMNEGNIIIRKLDDVNWIITVDAKDDKGNKITGSWTGEFFISDYSQSPAQGIQHIMNTLPTK